MNPQTIPPAKLAVLLVLVLAAVIGASLLSPIPQDPAYHRFADPNAWLGVRNGLNVLSNLAFLLVGLAGLKELAFGTPRGILPEFRVGYWIFFIGIAAIGLGSGYYHLAPDNGTLVWDRLPMTVAFMAFTAVVVAEHISIPWGRRLLRPLEILGVVSVFYWDYTEQAGHGDLRLYGLVQFLPMALVPLILWWFPSRLTGVRYLWLLLGGYVLAKLAELADGPFYQLVGISGHSLKHLIAAAAAYSLVLAVRNRRPVGKAG